MKRLATIGIVLATMHLFGAPSVEITNVQQQYPWTNTVDITYTVSGITNNDYFVVFEAKDADSNLLGAKTNVLEASGAGQTAQWEPPFNIRKLNCTMTPYVYRGGQDEYMIVDLETWEVTFEGLVGDQSNANEKYNTDEYKTKKMAFRKVEAGVYQIGTASGKTDAPNTVHNVTFSQPYYIAIFLMTKAQYARIASGDTASTDKLPQNAISWNTLRDSAGSASIPSGQGVCALMNAKNKANLRGFDLPTESMWEVAARAGVSTRYFSGNTSGEADGEYMWCRENSGGQFMAVGLKKPNAWGLYDVLGNIGEATRDTWNNGDLATLQTNGLVPINSGTAANFTRRSWSHDRSLYNDTYGDYGFPGRITYAKSNSGTWLCARMSYFPQ